MRYFLTTAALFLLLAFVPVSSSAQSLEWKIKGAPDDLEENMQLHLQGIGDLNGRTREQLVPALERAIIEAGRALGYYQMDYEWERDDNLITIKVTPGEPVRWQTLDLSIQGEGASEKALREIKNDHPFKEGKRINQGDYDKFKSRWLNQARIMGYRDARYTESALKLNLGEKSAHVILSLQTGEAYSVSRVSFEGSRLNQELLHRLVLVKSGDRYRADLLAQLYGQLLDTGYFEQISVIPVKEAPGKMAIEVSLVDSARHTFTTGVGFSTDTGPRVRLGWDMPLITNYGHQWHSEARVSAIEQRVSTEYRIPISNPLNHYLAADVGWRHKDVEDTETRVWETSFSHHSIRGG
ncbi:MAG: POTRA domain-containing protein, partial [Ketobacteraceae bacterium]|nr:POTRA domain-containing protein [Ketobacteraceae bacterium]